VTRINAACDKRGTEQHNFKGWQTLVGSLQGNQLQALVGSLQGNEWQPLVGSLHGVHNACQPLVGF